MGGFGKGQEQSEDIGETKGDLRTEQLMDDHLDDSGCHARL